MQWMVSVRKKNKNQPRDIVLLTFTSPDGGFEQAIAFEAETAMLIGKSFLTASDECSKIIQMPKQ